MATSCDPRSAESDASSASLAGCQLGVNFDARFENGSHSDELCLKMRETYVSYVAVDAIATRSRCILIKWSGEVTVERPFAARGGHPPRGRFGSTFESAAIVNDGSDTCGQAHMMRVASEVIYIPRVS